jgi:hypothetical protein
MHTYDVVVGVKLRLMVDLSDRPAGSIGIVTQTANNPLAVLGELADVGRKPL